MRFTPKFSRIATVAAGGVALALFMSSPAMADTSLSSATALQLVLASSAVVNTGQATANNDGTTETDGGDSSPTIAALGTQNVIAAGVLGQDARAFNDGSAAACAGVVGSGGAITVGDTGTCTVNNGSTVTLQLGSLDIAGITNAISLTFDAIYANCNATSTPSATGTATIANAKVVATVLGVPTTLLTLDATPSVNEGINIPGILTGTIDAQSSPSDGEVHVNAVQIAALSGTLASVTIGSVDCGPDAVADAVPSIPLKGLPIALGLGGLIAGGVLLVRRMRTV
jgi:hypothetical protein